MKTEAEEDFSHMPFNFSPQESGLLSQLTFPYQNVGGSVPWKAVTEQFRKHVDNVTIWQREKESVCTTITLSLLALFSNITATTTCYHLH